MPALAPDLTIQITFDPPADQYGRRLPNVTRRAFEEMALHWHRRFLRPHFAGFAHHRYGYGQRAVWYQRQKGNLPDLVYTGRMQEMMERPPTVRAYPTRARLTMAAPDYVQINFRDPRRPNLYREAKRLLPEEAAELKLVARLEAVEQLKAIKERRKVLVNGK